MKVFKLIRIYNDFLSNTSEIISTLDLKVVVDEKQIRDAVGDYALIRAQDAWNNYCRDMIIYSTIFDTLDANGKLYKRSPLGFNSMDEVLVELRDKWVNKSGKINKQSAHWEPKWFDRIHLSNASTILRISNSNIVGAIGLSTNPIEDMRAIRNYVAHRGKSTRLGVENYLSSIPQLSALGATNMWQQPFDIITYNAGLSVTSNPILFVEWMNRFRKVAYSMIS